MTIPTPPPEMIAEIARGMREPVEIAYQFGYAASEYYELEKDKVFLSAVAGARAELEKSGHAVKVKAQWMTENLMDDLYIRAKSAHASIQQVQESIKILSKLADLEPRGNVIQGGGGPGFTVVINIPKLEQKEAVVIENQAGLTFPKFEQPAEKDITPNE